MKTYQFHSELTCDEVWYRLNILLQNFAICGRKRCEIRGELTEWGCLLWLWNPGGFLGTPVPLCLWTEERQTSGCEIVCAFRLEARELRGLLIAGGVFCLEAFLAELIRGTPFFQALLTGVYLGCIAAALLYFLFFSLVRFFSRKREKELLAWIRTYLLLRHLDGVLLPEPEVQKAVWEGFSPQAGTETAEKRRRFAFRCSLPPEELPAALERWAAQIEPWQEGRQVKWSVQQRGNNVKLFRTEIETGRSEGVQAGAGFIGVMSRRYKSWQYANPFCGTVEPDGQGGCVLRGTFSSHRVFFLLSAAALLTICTALCRSLPPLAALPLSFFAVVHGVLSLSGNPLKNPGSRKILEFLQTHLEEI